ncbi:MAG TPA: DNA topoisomerase (ATP-hydrolyzing) subunit A [Anaerolineae bacterium]|nr:DNA topoisomerase (ATP-hydrolyzing) subunit A [Anaerolineae bacterium]
MAPKEIGVVRQIDIDSEMQQAYLSYAMSVIVARALPDARDGLKPVQRRILYAMHDMGLRPDAPYKKSARIVGEVLGKYHPHSDAAVYDTMARLAQDFSMRYLLVDGQGNFGSVDGDAPAAMRYTEARLGPLATEMLRDLEKQTVDFTYNFDGTLTEPSVLPSALPNLLVNGSTGIAVGMATNVPPHNLGEVCDALCYLIERWDRLDRVPVDELMQFIKGPDFPTGGVLFRYSDAVEGGDAIRAAYATGRGRVIVQAKAYIEEAERGKSRIIVTELPYAVNKAALIERIADLVRDGRIEGITDLRDESDRNGMRIIIELSRSIEDPRKTLGLLYKYTPMQSTFGMNLLALVDGEPRLLPLKRALQIYVEHRQTVVMRRSEHDLARAKERAHILEGLLKAIANLDEVIRIIRRSADAEAAKQSLMKRFRLTEMQATAILDMPLRRLARLEREKLEAEYKEKKKLIKYLEDLLGSPKKILGVIKDELTALKVHYGDARRTVVVERKVGDQIVTAAELLPDESTWVTINRDNKMLRMPVGPTIVKGRAPVAITHSNTRDVYVAINARGQCGSIAVHQISNESMPVAEVVGLPSDQRLVAAFSIPRGILAEQDGAENEHKAYLFLATRSGSVKRVAASDVIRQTGAFSVMNVPEDDEIVSAFATEGGGEVVVVTAAGKAIRFSEEEVRPMGLAAGGVAGIRLQEKDSVVAAALVRPRSDLLIVTEAGRGKRSSLAEFPSQGRAGQGVVAANLGGKDRIVGAAVVQAPDPLAVVTSRGKARLIRARALKSVQRASPPVAAIHLTKADSVAHIVVPIGRIAPPEPPAPAKPKRAARRASAMAKGKPAKTRPDKAKSKKSASRKAARKS